MFTKKIPGNLYPSLMFGLLLMVTAPCSYFLTVFFQENLHFSGSQIGFLYSLGAFTGVLCSLPAGYINDRVSSRAIVIISALLMATGYAGMAFVSAYVPYVFIYFLMSLAVATFKLSLDVQVLKANEGSTSGVKIAGYHAFRYAGQGIGTVFSGFLIAMMDWTYSLLGVALVCLLFIPMALKLPNVTMAKVPLKEYFAELKNPKAIVMAIWVFMFTLHWGAEYTSYGLFLRNDLGLNYQQMGLYMTGEMVALTVTVLIARKYVDRPGILTPFVLAGLFISGATMIGMTLQPLVLSVIFRFFHGIGDGLVFLVLFMGLVRLFDPAHLGGTTGFFNFVQMAGTIVGSLISGAVGERFGWATPLWGSGIICLLLILFIFICGRKGLSLEQEYVAK